MEVNLTPTPPPPFACGIILHYFAISSTYLVKGAVRRYRPPCSSTVGCSRCSPFVLYVEWFQVWPQGPDKTDGPNKKHRATGREQFLILASWKHKRILEDDWLRSSQWKVSGEAKLLRRCLKMGRKKWGKKRRSKNWCNDSTYPRCASGSIGGGKKVDAGHNHFQKSSKWLNTGNPC